MEPQSEGLPFERDLDDGVNAHTIPLPSESADSGNVRSFIFNVLVQQYYIDREYAEDIARLWTVGSGRELRQFPVRLFIEIFGQQAGWVLYKEATARVIEETVSQMDVFDYKKRESTMVFLLTLEVVLALLWAIFRPARLFIGLVFVIVAMIILLFAAVGRSDVDPRAKPETQLRLYFREKRR